MKIEKNRFVSLSYKLEVDGQIPDQSRPGQPLEFPFGAGYLLPAFEAHIEGLSAGDKFEFTLTPEQGYGEVIREAIVELAKETFMINGQIEEGLLTPGNQIPMSDSQGNRLLGTVVEVGEVVKMDFNHPMAGKTLHFTGEIVDVGETRPEDPRPPGGCSCGCEGGCDEHDHKGGCDCGGCH